MATLTAAMFLPFLWTMNGSRRVIIAAVDASSKAKTFADIVCTGVGDNIIIQNVIDGGGVIQMTGGTFHFDGPIRLGNSPHVITNNRIIGGGFVV